MIFSTKMLSQALTFLKIQYIIISNLTLVNMDFYNINIIENSFEL